MFYGPDTYYGEEVSVLEMDGTFDKLEELIYIESHLSNTSAKFYGKGWGGGVSLYRLSSRVRGHMAYSLLP